ncbi:MAG TPA: hypothetical protein DFR83_01745 [Deltaproteobacteria bacterium]|nr:hypothetical protein [Deltaproteobacteria bacterium]
MISSAVTAAVAMAGWLLGPLAFAGDIDAWQPGASSGAIDAPISGHSGALLSPGRGVVGAWSQLAHRPLASLDLAVPNPSWTPAVGLYTSAGVHGGWRPAGWAAPYDLGARLRARVAAQDVLGELGGPSMGPALDDAAIWLRRGLSGSGPAERSLFAEARADFQGSGASTDRLRALSGSGTGVALGWAERRETSAPGLTQHLSLAAAADLRGPEQTDLAPRQSVEGRAGWSWTPGRLTGLSELHLRGSRHAPASASAWLAGSIEPRLGLRGRTGAHLQWAGVIGAGIPFRDPTTSAWVQPTGAPRWRVGLDLRWGPADTGTAGPDGPPLRSGELVVSPRSPAGAPLVAVVSGPGTDQVRLRADGSVVLPYTPGEPLTVTADGHATLTQAPRVSGKGPWTWQPTLLLREGDARLTLRIADEQDLPVALDALSVAGAPLGGTQAGTAVTLEGLAPGPAAVFATGPLLQPSAIEPLAAVDAPTQTLYLARPVGATRVSVAGNNAPLPGAWVQLTSAVGTTALQTDEQGLVQTRLTAGQWQIRVEADGFSSQEQIVEIAPEQGRLHEVPFLLVPPVADAGQSLDLTIVDPWGQPIEGADVRLGDQPLGTTASGGRLRLEDVSRDEADLQVAADRFRPYASQVATSQTTERSIIVPMRWRTGQVEIRALSLTGDPVAQATAVVRSEADTPAEPRPLGPDGMLAFELPTGDHEVVVTAPDHVSVVVPVRIHPDRDTLHVAHVVLPPASTGRASLSVRVSSPLESFVQNARVLVDGEERARTSSGSAVRLDGLTAGRHEITIEGALYETWSAVVNLQDNATEALEGVLRPRSGLLEVTASFAGEPFSALVRPVGSLPTRPVLLGDDGHHLFSVPAGEWEILFSAEAYGATVLIADVHPERNTTSTWVPKKRVAPIAMAAPVARPVDVVVKDRATEQAVPALVRAIGDEFMPPTQSGADGHLQLKLLPGTWEIIASNPELGIGGTELQVTIRDAVDPVEIWIGQPKVQLTGDELRLDGFVLFEVGSARIEPASVPLLTELARTLVLAPEIRRVRVEGHTDDTGDSERNMTLSEARARAVMAWLIDAGVSPDRLEAQGFGEQQPAASNADDAGRLQNRRVVMRVLEREAVGEDATQ